jgi:DNA polymerase-3 subunit gamma/tau
MKHLVLARKYRPKTFAEVVGQDLIVQTLTAALRKKRVAHAFLFTGSRGIGKTTIARLLAKALVCTKLEDVEPCNACALCQSIDNFSSLDVVEIDGASHTGVDDIRELRDSARYQPASAKYKIFIIDEVHMLSTNAFNALLKILEEPPAHVIFMFATTESHKIPKTILSRCQRYDLRRVGLLSIRDTVKCILEKEHITIDNDGLLLIAELSDGGLRDALSITEQIISNDQKSFSASDIARILGVVDHKLIKDLSSAIIEQAVDPAIALVHQAYEQGLDLSQMLDSLVERLRTLSLCAHLNDAALTSRLIPSLDEELIKSSRNANKDDLKRLFAMALDGMPQVFQAKKPLFALELLILRMALRPPLKDAMSINFLINKLDAVLNNRPLPSEKDFLAHGFPTSITEKKSLADPSLLFAQSLDELARSLPSLASHLRHARPEFREEEKSLTLHFEHSLHFDFVLPHKDRPELHEALKKVFLSSLNIKIILDKNIDSSTKNIKTVAENEQIKKEQDVKDLHNEARNHPLIKKALDIFGGDITKVERLTNF